MGDVDNAIEAVTGLSDLGFDGLGVDNAAEIMRGGSSADILYEGTFADFTVALSTELTNGGDDTDWAAGAKYAMGDYSVALGVASISAFTTTDPQGRINCQSLRWVATKQLSSFKLVPTSATLL